MADTSKISKSDTLIKTVFHWALTILIIILLIMLISSAVVQMLAPTFFPNVDISGFIDVIETANTLLSVLSLALAVLSIGMSRQSGKQAEEILNGVSKLKDKQDSMEFMIANIGRIFSIENSKKKEAIPNSGPDPVDD